MINKINTLKNQSGVVLVVSLIMLVLLSLIGITGTQVTGLEEKMANNNRDKNLAFQAAEAALRAGEIKIESKTTTEEFAATTENGLLSKDESVPDHFNSNTWTDNDSFSFDANLDQVNIQPRYFIKYTGDHEVPCINTASYGQPCSVIISYFTVTSKGTGAQDTSEAYLRLNYGKEFY
ncbi:MAG: PilX N-terminal domain-containing pilus assembly protein [Methylococcales bacterium]|nr:PilX N-terminal domain-containing pilus assembly protein [Methylococcales bacterium]